ncbi:hypothetical protein FRC12_007936, partial [Ceratobasidium sp. 428]
MRHPLTLVSLLALASGTGVRAGYCDTIPKPTICDVCPPVFNGMIIPSFITADCKCVYATTPHFERDPDPSCTTETKVNESGERYCD